MALGDDEFVKSEQNRLRLTCGLEMSCSVSCPETHDWANVGCCSHVCGAFTAKRCFPSPQRESYGGELKECPCRSERLGVVGSKTVDCCLQRGLGLPLQSAHWRHKEIQPTLEEADP